MPLLLEQHAGALFDLTPRRADLENFVGGTWVAATGDRARTIVSGAYALYAKRTTVVSTEETSIDGKKILLG